MVTAQMMTPAIGAKPPAMPMKMSRFLNEARFEASIRHNDNKATAAPISAMLASVRAAESPGASPVIAPASVIATIPPIAIEL